MKTSRIRLVAGLASKIVRSQLSLAMRLRDSGQRALAFYLHETKARGLYQEWGFGSVVAYAEKELGMKRRSARDYVSVGAALSELPHCDAAFCEGRLTWSKLRLLARIASVETEAEWVAKAETISFDELEREIAGLSKGDRPRTDKLGLPSVRFTVTVRIDAVTFAEWERLKEKTALESGEATTDSELFQRFTRIMLADPEGADARAAERPRAELVIGRCSKGCCTEVRTEEGPVPLDDLTAEMICCDSVSDETPAWLRKKILARDGKRCILCQKTNLLDVHHIVLRSSRGRTEPKNLTTLCRPCHALVHEELVRISGEAPHRLVITDREGKPVAKAPRRNEGVRIVMSGAAAPPPVSEGVEDTRLPDSGSRGLDDIVGQKRLVESLRLLLAGSKGEPALDPILLTGEPGFGKTSIAEAIAAELQAPLRLVSSPLVRDAATLVSALVRAEARSVLFIDEIHALPIEALNVLLEALEKRRLSMPGRTIELKAFTVIAATNHPERLPNALHSRFVTRERLDDYTEEDLATIASRTAAIGSEEARKIARVSRGTPRECVNIAKRLATMAKASGERNVDVLLEGMGIDARGLDPADRKIVAALQAVRKPLSLAGLAARTGIAKETILERHEPYLLKLGVVEVTPLGRVAGLAQEGTPGPRSVASRIVFSV